MNSTQILTAVSNFYGIKLIHGRLRTDEYLRAKYAASLMLKKQTDLPLRTIAGEIGLKSPAAAWYNILRAEKQISEDADFASEVEQIERGLKPAA